MGLYFEGSWNATLGAKTYIKSVCDRIEKLLEKPLKNTGAPWGAGDHPEVDDTDLLIPSKIPVYQMMIGCLQWAVNQYSCEIWSEAARWTSEDWREPYEYLDTASFMHVGNCIWILDPSPTSYERDRFQGDDWTECYPACYPDKNAPAQSWTQCILIFKWQIANFFMTWIS